MYIADHFTFSNKDQTRVFQNLVTVVGHLEEERNRGEISEGALKGKRMINKEAPTGSFSWVWAALPLPVTKANRAKCRLTTSQEITWVDWA